MGKLPTLKKILREDVKDAPRWIDPVIDTLNSFMDNTYSLFNKNITYSENVQCFVKELIYVTPSTYPTMDNVEFSNTLKIKATGVQLLQVYDRSSYTAPVGPVYIPWVENNGTIVISAIPGLLANKSYTVRILVS